MEISGDTHAARIRERRAKPPWTFRCRRSGEDVVADIDAFDEHQAAVRAAAHWGIDAGLVRMEGRRRRWMRWIGLSTHEARDPGRERAWWYGAKLGVLVAAAAAAAYATHLAL